MSTKTDKHHYTDMKRGVKQFRAISRKKVPKSCPAMVYSMHYDQPTSTRRHANLGTEDQAGMEFHSYLLDEPVVRSLQWRQTNYNHPIKLPF